MQKIVLMTMIVLTAYTQGMAKHLLSANAHKNNPYYSTTDTTKLSVNNATWKKILPPELYAVSRLQATEKASTAKHLDNETKETYSGAVWGNNLSRSPAKFASTCGCPRFCQPIRKNSVI